MKKNLLLAIVLCLGIISCEKKITAYWESIDGVNLKDEYGMNIGILGTPNVFIEDSTISLFIYDNPCKEILKYKVYNKSSKDLFLQFELYPVSFKNLPNMPTVIGQGSIPIENLHLNGAFSVREYGDNLSENSNSTFTSDISNLPRGFYKLIITTNEGKEYWDNIWIYR